MLAEGCSSSPVQVSRRNPSRLAVLHTPVCPALVTYGDDESSIVLSRGQRGGLPGCRVQDGAQSERPAKQQ